jgi:MFS family permease
MNRAMPPPAVSRRRAVTFIVMIGCVSLFADVTYEGGRSIAGPFLGSLGASAVIVSIVAGLGEFLGYGVRYLSGRAADRSQRYWSLMLAGYTINLLSVPLLALAGAWPVAMLLLLGERLGRAIRAPIRSAMLSHAATRTGAGWAFGLHTALDQTGGVSGPLLVAALLGLGAGYHRSFATLVVPAVTSLAILLTARRLYPNPRALELNLGQAGVAAWSGFGRTFRLYTVGASFMAAGFADFALIAFHLARAHTVPVPWVPVLYAGAMAAEGLGALVLGRLLDRLGPRVAAAGTALAALAVPLVFLGGPTAAAAGVVFWGVGMATGDTILHALLGALVAPAERATAYGLFDAIRGTAWLAGSVVLGLLYAVSIPALVAFSLLLQLTAVPVLLRAGGES